MIGANLICQYQKPVDLLCRGDGRYFAAGSQGITTVIHNLIEAVLDGILHDFFTIGQEAVGGYVADQDRFTASRFCRFSKVCPGINQSQVNGRISIRG